MLVVDAHLDFGLNALFYGRDLKQPVAEIRRWEQYMLGKSRGRNTVGFPDMRRGEVFLSFSTILARHAAGLRSNIDFPPEAAFAAAHAQLIYYSQLEDQGILRRIRTRADLDDHLAAWQAAPAAAPLGHVLSMEGADPILHPDQVFDWRAQGLHSLSLAHYGVSAYAHGTNTVGGVFPPARELLANMARLGMLLDLTHTSDEAFWEELELYPGRVIASHNNCRTLVPRQRQFSDDMLRALIERDAVIGTAFDAWMLDPDWNKDDPTPERVSLGHVVDHIDHICQLAGNARHVGLGTDLDGGYGREQSPGDLDTIADLQNIPGLLRARGYSEADIEGIMHGNWLRLLRETLPV